MGDQVVEVECYSGASYAERPLALFWRGERIPVSRILNSQLTPDGKRFEVKLENGWSVSLIYRTQIDQWTASGLPG